MSHSCQDIVVKNDKVVAKKEIHKTLKMCNVVIRLVGLSFIDDPPKAFFNKLKNHISFMTSSSLLFLMLLGEIAYTASLVVGSVSLEEFIGSYLHIAGYDTMSFGKLITIWYKRNAFRQLVTELPDIWPVSIKEKESVEIKRNSLSALRIVQNFYLWWTVCSVWMYNLSPIILHFYFVSRGVPSEIGYIWHIYYPFDQTKPVLHALVYVFEILAGGASVCCMLGADILFITMASHISMLLRQLQVKIRHIGSLKQERFVEGDKVYFDCYNDIISLVRIHQRLISYGNDLEDAFTVVNLINVLLSSVNLCCCVFSVVFLEPWASVSNKFFIVAVLFEMGLICWYADDIYRASLGVSDAVYESGWYNCNVRCRRALLLLLQRSQRPLYFTALKFGRITMSTFGSILTTSYSYFTLLYTSYRRA